MSAEDHDLTASAVSARLWWAVPAGGVLFLMTVALIFGNPQTNQKTGTSYDASFRGFRAAYLLLEELGYPVVRSRRLTGGAARLILLPTSAPKDGDAQPTGVGSRIHPGGFGGEALGVDEWIRQGGTLVLADDSGDFARKIGLNVISRQEEKAPEELETDGVGVAKLAPGRPRVECPGQSGHVWVRAGGKAAITIYERGSGEIWLLNMPHLFDNQHLKKADNAILLCRLADDVSRGRSGDLCFDEYFHGLRDRPGVTELLFQPPTVWVSLQSLLFIGLLIWHFAPRFGTFRPEARLRRRSKEEFLDAVASLLERKGDYQAAYRVVREDLLRALEANLGLPAASPPEHIIPLAVVHRGKPMESLLEPLTRSLPVSAGKRDFLTALNEMETTRDGFFDKQHGR